MTLRPLAAADIPVLASALANMSPWSVLGYGADALAAYLSKDDPALIRMVQDGHSGGVAGVISLRRPWLRGPYVELLAVLPSAQGAGLGRNLIRWAATQGGGNLWACVSSFNQSARDFYARQGFAEITTLPDLVTAGFDEILLRRRG